MAYHMRSVSLPTQSHPYILKAEEDLQKLKGFVSSSPSLTYQMIFEALHSICSLYESIIEIPCMSSRKNGLFHPQQIRLVDQELEESINLLDICSKSRDNLSEIKTHIQDLESAHRRCESEAIKSNTRAYIHLTNKAYKHVKKQASRKTESMEGATSVLGLLGDAREIIISMLQSIFSYMSKQLVVQKTRKWSLVSTSLQKKRNDYTQDQENSLYNASLRFNVEELEAGLECLFRQMIKCRVFLLNNFSL